MPHCPLLPCEKVLHLQTCGGIAARVRAEASCDLKPSVGDSVVPGTKPWPVPKALLPTSLLLETSVKSAAAQAPAWGVLHTSLYQATPHPLSSLKVNLGCLNLAALWRLGKMN